MTYNTPTPRTDTIEKQIDDFWEDPTNPPSLSAVMDLAKLVGLPTPLGFARQLERENQQLQNELEIMTNDRNGVMQANEKWRTANTNILKRAEQADQQVEELKEQLEHAINPIHSCGEHCQRPACVNRRQVEELRKHIVILCDCFDLISHKCAEKNDDCIVCNAREALNSTGGK